MLNFLFFFRELSLISFLFIQTFCISVLAFGKKPLTVRNRIIVKGVLWTSIRGSEGSVQIVQALELCQMLGIRENTSNSRWGQATFWSFFLFHPYYNSAADALETANRHILTAPFPSFLLQLLQLHAELLLSPTAPSQGLPYFTFCHQLSWSLFSDFMVNSLIGFLLLLPSFGTFSPDIRIPQFLFVCMCSPLPPFLKTWFQG